MPTHRFPTPGRCARFALALALSFLPAAAALAQSATITGPPTFSVTTTVDVDRGTAPGGLFARVARNTGRRSSGDSQAALPPSAYLPTDVPTQGGGVASDTQLRSLATAGGSTAFAANGVEPFVSASNEAVITRFFEFRSGTGGQTVALEPIILFDGFLEHDLFGGDPVASGTAQVSLALDLIDPNQRVLQSVFEVRARLLGPSFSTPILLSSSIGAADLAVWQQSLNRVSPTRVEVGYLDTLENAANVPVGVPIGLRWTLETDASFRGQFATGAMISDFYNTATLGFDFAPSEVGASFVEILTVPEPGLGALLAVGGVVAIVVRRRR